MLALCGSVSAVPYTHSRAHNVSVSEGTSQVLPVLPVVSQGSSLGPMLFLYCTYINDLSLSVTHSSLSMFAEDTKCYKETLSTIDKNQLQHDLDEINDWSQLWNIFLNDSKIVNLSFPKKGGTLCSNGCSTRYTINGFDIIQSVLIGTSQLQCVLICHGCSFGARARAIIQKAYGSVCLTHQSFSSFSISARNLRYLSMVGSKMTSCS